MKIFTEKEAEDFLENSGFKIAKKAIAKNIQDFEKAKSIKFPWAMKVNSKVIVHKKQEGGVFLNILDMKQAKESLDKLSKLKGYESVIIQGMAKGEELILGLKKTPEFGLVVMLGKGGSGVEKEKDVAFRVLPIEKKDAQEMIKEIKFFASLQEKKVNLLLIEENILKLSTLAKNNPDIKELDINPLMVDENDAVVVDARIVFEE